MSDTVRLTEEFRGGLLDLTHYGYISIVDEKGKVIYSAGDPEAMVFYRSASKPVQALPVIAHHLDEKYGFTDEETVLFAGSHLGESFHVNALKSIMKKADLNPEDLIMKPTVPGSTEANEERIRQGLPKSKLYHNCSGKHAALMLTQREMGGDVKDYWKVGSVGQNEVLRTMSVLSEYPEEKVVIGIDGCSVGYDQVREGTQALCIGQSFSQMTQDAFTCITKLMNGETLESDVVWTEPDIVNAETIDNFPYPEW